jgi:hypothetical protein
MFSERLAGPEIIAENAESKMSASCLQAFPREIQSTDSPSPRQTICFAQTVCKTAGPFPVIKGMPQNRDSVIKHSFLD